MGPKSTNGEVVYLLQDNVQESICFDGFDVIHDIGVIQLLHQLNFRLNGNTRKSQRWDLSTRERPMLTSIFWRDSLSILRNGNLFNATWTPNVKFNALYTIANPPFPISLPICYNNRAT